VNNEKRFGAWVVREIEETGDIAAIEYCDCDAWVSLTDGV
jgi:hypothetical protein